MWNQRNRLFYNAPAVILVCRDIQDETTGFSRPVALYNCSRKAHTISVGSCFKGLIKSTANHTSKIRKWLSTSRSQKCHATMPLAYQDVQYNRIVKNEKPDVRWL